MQGGPVPFSHLINWCKLLDLGSGVRMISQSYPWLLSKEEANRVYLGFSLKKQNPKNPKEHSTIIRRIWVWGKARLTDPISENAPRGQEKVQQVRTGCPHATGPFEGNEHRQDGRPLHAHCCAANASTYRQQTLPEEMKQQTIQPMKIESLGNQHEAGLSARRCSLTCKNPGSKSAKCLNRATLCSLASMKAAVALADNVRI